MTEARATEWVCGACGKHGPERDRIGDVSCYLNSVLCYVDSLQFDTLGRLVYADAVPVASPE